MAKSLDTTEFLGDILFTHFMNSTSPDFDWLSVLAIIIGLLVLPLMILPLGNVGHHIVNVSFLQNGIIAITVGIIELITGLSRSSSKLLRKGPGRAAIGMGIFLILIAAFNFCASFVYALPSF